MINLFKFKTAVPYPAAIYPLSGVTGGKDISRNRNIPARIHNVRPATGPDRLPSGAQKFRGLPNSYIYFPNNGNLDTKNSITIIAWIKPMSSGPILHFRKNSWNGVHLWIVGGAKKRQLFVRFSSRLPRRVKAIKSSAIKMKQWNFVAATYNGRNGRGILWSNGIPVAQRKVKIYQALSVNHSVLTLIACKTENYA